MLHQFVKNQLAKILILTFIFLLSTNGAFSIDKKSKQITNKTSQNIASVSAAEIQRITDQLQTKLSSRQIKNHQTSPLSQMLKSKKPNQLALNRMNISSGQSIMNIQWHEKNATPTFISVIQNNRSLSKSVGSIPAKTVALDFIKANSSLFQLENVDTELQVAEETSDRLGKTHVKFRQYYEGIPIWGHDMVSHIDEKNQVYAINARYAPTPKSLDVKKWDISSEVASQIALKDLEKTTAIIELPAWAKKAYAYQAPQVKRYIWIDDKTQQPHLVWHIQIRPNIRDNWYYFIDVQTGAILEKYNATNFDGPAIASATDLNGATQTIHSYQYQGTYYMIDASRPMWQSNQSDILNDPQGAILTIDAKNRDLDQYAELYHVASTNNTWSDRTAVSAHSNMGLVYDYFYNTFGRNAIDGNGSTIISIIHVTDGGEAMDNAYWSGAYMAYGDGNVAFKPLGGGLDVAAHELTHGITEYTTALEYKYQSGALNESFSDVFGVMVDRDDWKLGEDVVRTQYFPTGAMRDMANPHNGASANDDNWQPAVMSEYVELDISQDNGGVHINCGIPNHACYLIGNAIGKAKTEKIYYRIMEARYLNTQSNFVDMRLATIQSAKELYGDNSTEMNAVIAAFDAVGIGSSGGSQPDPDLPPVEGDEWIATIDYQSQSLYLAKPVIQDQNTDIVLLTATKVSTETGNPISVTDDGSFIMFVDANHNIRVINSDGSNEEVIGSDAVWNSIALSPDGMKLAATTTLQDSSIYIFDFSGNNNNKRIRLYSPTTQEGVRDYTTILADAMDWNLSSDHLIFDAYNRIAKAGGSNLEYWTINVLDPATEIIYLLFPPQTEGVSIGNPSFGQTNDIYFVFDYIDEAQGHYQILSANLYTGEVFLIEDNEGSIGYPRYSTDDLKLVFERWQSDWWSEIPTLRQISLKDSKTEPAGNSTEYVTQGLRPSWFAIGERTAVDKSNEVQPGEFSLAQNYPNPFNPVTKISYAIPQSGLVTLKIYDIGGREIQTLIHEIQPAGSYTFDFDAKGLASGVYFYRLEVDDHLSEIKKMMYLK